MAKTIMIQGTMSNVGKSLLTAALCRIFTQDGYSVAPFKSQNMANNSFVTAEGLEIGRAQALQAQAAGEVPTADMNPILLKPTSDSGSQVIVHGKAVGNMSAREYFSRKREFLPAIDESFSRLCNSHDIVVIEGAGSPVELNLKSDDIVNMGIAKRYNVPVLLVGDIDRGGVFAQLFGTMSLLDEDERTLVKGLIVNKFRGDSALFAEGVKILESKCKVPVLGVVPFVHCDIEDEDSLSDRITSTADENAVIDIAVIKLPRMANFTDFDVFGQFSGVGLRYVSNLHDLKNPDLPDLIIVPGTKSTISDMLYLRESGFEAAIKKAAANGTPVVGICGGYQILGDTIADPNGAEGSIPEVRGMELLSVSTVFSEEKHTAQVEGKFGELSGFFGCLSGLEFSGYEIHHGRTTVSGEGLSVLDGTRTDGCYSGNVMGSYVHGIFDRPEVCTAIVKALYERKGLCYGENVSLTKDEQRDRELDKLAKVVRESLDMAELYRILNGEI